jgi:hypothetical protein
MICPKYKTIFIHIPKTAGTSVESMFGFVETFPNSRKFIENTRGKHLLAHELKSSSPIEFDNYFKWSIVRNPWARELSYYNMVKFQLKHRHMDFKQYLKESATPNIKSKKRTLKNQVDYLLIDDNVAVDEIVRYENLEYGWQRICEKINKPYEKLNHLRKTKTKQEIHEIYDQECIDIVADLRKDDIEFLNYDFTF